MNNKIVKAYAVDPVNYSYTTYGDVVRVFDTNGQGDLIPVAYMKVAYNHFNLHFAPHGDIYAEINQNNHGTY
jgi:hypothetical protein